MNCRWVVQIKGGRQKVSRKRMLLRLVRMVVPLIISLKLIKTMPMIICCWRISIFRIRTKFHRKFKILWIKLNCKKRTKFKIWLRLLILNKSVHLRKIDTLIQTESVLLNIVIRKVHWIKAQRPNPYLGQVQTPNHRDLAQVINTWTRLLWMSPWRSVSLKISLPTMIRGTLARLRRWPSRILRMINMSKLKRLRMSILAGRHQRRTQYKIRLTNCSSCTPFSLMCLNKACIAIREWPRWGISKVRLVL